MMHPPHPIAADPASPAARVIASAGLQAVIAERLAQVERWGHTPEADAARPLWSFFVDLRNLTNAACDWHRFRSVKRAQLRRQLVKLAAFAIALVDRLDAEPLMEGDD